MSPVFACVPRPRESLGSQRVMGPPSNLTSQRRGVLLPSRAAPGMPFGEQGRGQSRPGAGDRHDEVTLSVPGHGMWLHKHTAERAAAT